MSWRREGRAAADEAEEQFLLPDTGAHSEKTEYPKGKSARDIAKTLGIRHTTVNRMITELDEAGELKNVERGTFQMQQRLRMF